MLNRISDYPYLLEREYDPDLYSPSTARTMSHIILESLLWVERLPDTHVAKIRVSMELLWRLMQESPVWVGDCALFAGRPICEDPSLERLLFDFDFER